MARMDRQRVIRDDARIITPSPAVRNGGTTRSRSRNVPAPKPMDDITIKLGEPPGVADVPIVVNGNGNGSNGSLTGPMPPPPPPDQSNPAIFGPLDTPALSGNGMTGNGGGMPVRPEMGRQMSIQTKPIERGRLFGSKKQNEWIKLGGINGLS